MLSNLIPNSNRCLYFFSIKKNISKINAFIFIFNDMKSTQHSLDFILYSLLISALVSESHRFETNGSYLFILSANAVQTGAFFIIITRM